MTKFGLPYWATPPLAGAVCFGVGIPVRPAGAAARRPLSGARDLRARDRDAAAPQAQRASTPGPAAPQGLPLAKPDSPFGAAADADQWLYLLLPAPRVMLCAAAQPGARPHRARAASRSAIIRSRPRRWASTCRSYKATCFGVSALYAGIAGALGAHRRRVRLARQFHAFLSLPFLVGVVVGGLASIRGSLFGAVFIELVPDLRRPALGPFGQSAKACRARSTGCCSSLHDG